MSLQAITRPILGALQQSLEYDLMRPLKNVQE